MVCRAHGIQPRASHTHMQQAMPSIRYWVHPNADPSAPEELEVARGHGCNTLVAARGATTAATIMLQVICGAYNGDTKLMFASIDGCKLPASEGVCQQVATGLQAVASS